VSHIRNLRYILKRKADNNSYCIHSYLYIRYSHYWWGVMLYGGRLLIIHQTAWKNSYSGHNHGHNPMDPGHLTAVLRIYILCRVYPANRWKLSVSEMRQISYGRSFFRFSVLISFVDGNLGIRLESEWNISYLQISEKSYRKILSPYRWYQRMLGNVCIVSQRSWIPFRRFGWFFPKS